MCRQDTVYIIKTENPTTFSKKDMDNQITGYYMSSTETKNISKHINSVGAVAQRRNTCLARMRPSWILSAVNSTQTTEPTNKQGRTTQVLTITEITACSFQNLTQVFKGLWIKSREDKDDAV